MISQILRTTIIPANGFNFSMLVFRCLVSLNLLLVHGLPKVLDFQSTKETIPDPFGIGGFPTAIIAVTSDFVGAAFVALGLLFRISVSFILVVTLTGLFIVHASDPWPEKDIPYMYSASFILLFLLGPGEFSLDGSIQKKLKST